jgi:hypothetical protein
MFDVDPNIDIHSKALLDMIAETEAEIGKEAAGPVSQFGKNQCSGGVSNSDLVTTF